MKQLLLISVFFCSIFQLAAQKKQAYQIFDAKGKKVSYEKMLKKLKEKDIVLFGEFHNNPIIHWLQLELTQDLGKTRNLILGAEMFEADNQTALSQFVAGEIDDKQLAKDARLWKNYPTDYAPLVKYAKTNKLVFVATNIPRIYASRVAKGGFEVLDTLPENQKMWIAPLPVSYDAELPGYKAMLKMMGEHVTPNLPKAQAIKDATMSHFILKNYKEGSLFIHYNGSYHSDNYEGILWYLKKAKPELKYGTIGAVSQKSVNKLEAEYKGKADFIICVDEDMTTTY
ncbi:MAG: ChaN family lipoprotein [Chitinophagaceae bacterium]|nr:ChaN family lipoprotein [Chitinophagaceae bacterium]